MNRIAQLTRRHVALLAALAAIPAASALAQDAGDEHVLGQHPAVIVAARGVQADPTANFYRHPAGLDLRGALPDHNGEHPAVLIARGAGRQGIDPNTFIVGHPASPTWRADDDEVGTVATVSVARGL